MEWLQIPSIIAHLLRRLVQDIRYGEPTPEQRRKGFEAYARAYVAKHSKPDGTTTPTDGKEVIEVTIEDDQPETKKDSGTSNTKSRSGGRL